MKTVFCKFCLFSASTEVTVIGIMCHCARCHSIRANGFCNEYHETAYRQLKARTA